ncbi:MAG: winged helix-turn-helix transcriptional regulator [Thermoplasmatales archaeon]|nr:winged helix-turn-helix transcriptional regulator [Thermoplasmatales archaeon]
MISKENILKLETRREIYNFILKYPGLHLRELSRRINLSFGGLRHNLNFLEKQGLISTRADGRYTRYYVTQKVGKNDKEILNLLRQEAPRKIIYLLLTPGPGEIYKTKDAQEKAMSNPSTFLKTYSKKELVELTKYWKGLRTHLVRLDKHRTTIDFHLNKLQEIDLIEKIKVGKEIKYVLKDEEMIWAFFVRYQKELSDEVIDIWIRSREKGLIITINNMSNFFLDMFPIPFCA